MELYAPVGTLFEGWTEQNVQLRIAGHVFPGHNFYSTMDEAAWSVAVQGYIPNVGRIVSGRSGEPERAILQVAGGGMFLGRSWSVWYMTGWSDRDNVPSLSGRRELADRRAFLLEAIAKWEAAFARDPSLPMRPGVETWRAEVAEIEEQLSRYGDYELVVYVGYARRWGRDAYVLAG